MKPESHGTTAKFERGLTTPAAERFVLRLYVTGMTPRSTESILTIKAVCEEHLAGRYDLEVIDIYQNPELVRDEQILAAPTLVRKLPMPLRKLIGNLSDKQRLLVGLDLRPARGGSSG